MNEDKKESNFRIALFERKQVRRVIHNNEWWFVVEDVVLSLIDSRDAKQYIQRMKQRDPELSKGWVQIVHTLPIPTFGLTPSQHAEFKRLRRENLRDHMTDLELIFSMLGEAATTEIKRNRDAQGFPLNRQAARAGGAVAGNARRELEAKSGRRVVTQENYLGLTQSESKRMPKNFSQSARVKKD